MAWSIPDGEMGTPLEDLVGSLDDPDPAAGEEPGQEPPAAPPEPSLEGLDDAAKQQVAAWAAHRDQQLREQWQQVGMDLAADGTPVIRDAARMAQWSGFDQRPAHQASTVAQQAPTVAQAAAQPPTDEPLPDDMFSWTPAQMKRFVDQQVEQQTAPLRQELQAARGHLARRSTSEAMGQLRNDLAAYAPGNEDLVETPGFEEAFRNYAAQMDPTQLEDPRVRTGMALSLRPWLAAPSSRGPVSPGGGYPREAGVHASNQPRDTQGRFTQQAEYVRNASARQTLGQVPPARMGAAPEPPPAQIDRVAAAFIEATTPRWVKNRTITAQEAEILGQVENIDDWQRLRQAAGGRR